MTWTCVLALTLTLSVILPANADSDLRKGCGVRFASVSEGAEILGSKDDFIQRLSAFDRAARMKTDRSVDENEFAEFVKKTFCRGMNRRRQKLRQQLQAFALR